MLPVSRLALRAIISLLLPVCVASAQPRTGATIVGHIADAADGHPLTRVTVGLERIAFTRHSDSSGHYRVAGLPSARQVLLTWRVAYAVAHAPVTLPASGALDRDGMAAMALHIPQFPVTADAVGRGRGALGTGSVIGREAMTNQSASSVAGTLQWWRTLRCKRPVWTGCSNSQFAWCLRQLLCLTIAAPRPSRARATVAATCHPLASATEAIRTARH